MSDTAVEPSRAGGSWLSRLLVAFGFANVADGVGLVLLSIVTVSLTHSPIALGAVALARTLPWSLLATPVGVHADRSPLRVLMISANAVRCVIMVVLAGLIVLDHLPLAVVIVAAGLIGVCEVYYDIAAQTARLFRYPRPRPARPDRS
ncbi:hypothetical protein ABT158_30695 [Nonomuraea sp. NPDC001636]|uniref:hypothetical protein n=1 Tax=Nonomuraea sp. NPDC001636 TaxID=3154391 RepID=UPI003326425B